MIRLKSKRGQETLARILEEAVQYASIQGLESLTIGNLSKALDLSKSGLFGHFGSKLELQKFVVDAAQKVFREAVIEPAESMPFGKDRLLAVCTGWLNYLEHFRGGCFFAAATAEFDGRPGEVNDMLREIMTGWLKFLRREVIEAQKTGGLSPNLDPDQAVFELQSIVMGANWFNQLLDDHTALARARTAIARLFDLEPGNGGYTHGRGF